MCTFEQPASEYSLKGFARVYGGRMTHDDPARMLIRSSGDRPTAEYKAPIRSGVASRPEMAAPAAVHTDDGSGKGLAIRASNGAPHQHLGYAWPQEPGVTVTCSAAKAAAPRLNGVAFGQDHVTVFCHQGRRWR